MNEKIGGFVGMSSSKSADCRTVTESVLHSHLIPRSTDMAGQRSNGVGVAKRGERYS